jgi:hypothetical protein
MSHEKLKNERPTSHELNRDFVIMLGVVGFIMLIVVIIWLNILRINFHKIELETPPDVQLQGFSSDMQKTVDRVGDMLDDAKENMPLPNTDQPFREKVIEAVREQIARDRAAEEASIELTK